MLEDSRQFKISVSWAVALGIVLFGVFLSLPVQAAVFTVNSLSDLVDAAPGNGVCETASGNGVCTLRAAIMEANHFPGGPHTVEIPPGTYTLTIPNTGEGDGTNETTGDLDINASMNIVGAGSSSTIIDGNGNATNDRIIQIISDPLIVTVTISGVTLRNGRPGNRTGGGISNGGGALTLINSTVSGNTSLAGGGIVSGGGGITNFATLALINSTVSGNSTTGQGAGIWNLSTLTLTSSTVSGNSTSGGVGGGISHIIGILTMINSTVSGNSASGSGGGIYNDQQGTVDIFNSTITRNTTGVGTAAGVGGGVSTGSSSVTTFQNTIVAGNRAVINLSPLPLLDFDDCAGTIHSDGHNLMGVQNCTVTGAAPIVADPQLGTLQNNGGPTQTHALPAGSVAIDAGDCTLGAKPATDQRGFPRQIDGNNDGVVRCDIGAYELFTGAATSVVAALLPSSRSVQVGTTATVFATVINTGQAMAAGCSIAPLTNVPASFVFQTTDPATNQVIGFPNTSANIAAGVAQSFVLAITPTAPIAPTEVEFSFDCENTDPAPIHVGLNTLLLSASSTPVPDIVALAATLSNDGIVNIAGTNGAGAFAVATVNLGAGGSISASADTGNTTPPVVISLCETNPPTGQCISTIGPTVMTTINSNATPTFGIFVQGTGNVPFDPAANRIFVRFEDGGRVTRGSTSVAVRTQ